MSDFADKLQTSTTIRPGAARATMAQLQKRWGVEECAPDADRVRIVCMGVAEDWFRVYGKGDKSLFEKCTPNPTEQAS